MRPVPLKYPDEFNAESRNSVELEIARGRLKLDKVRKNLLDTRSDYLERQKWKAAGRSYVLEGCLAFNKTACQLLERDAIPSEKLTGFRFAFLESLILEAERDQGFSASGEPNGFGWENTSRFGPRGHGEFLTGLKLSPEWALMLRQQERALRRKSRNKQPLQSEDQKPEANRRKLLRDGAKNAMQKTGKRARNQEIAAAIKVGKDVFNDWLSAKQRVNPDTAKQIEDSLCKLTNGESR